MRSARFCVIFPLFLQYRAGQDQANGTNAATPRYIVVCEDDSLWADNPFFRIAMQAGLGFCVIMLARSRDALPKECARIVDLSIPGKGVLYDRRTGHADGFQPRTGTARTAAGRLCRARASARQRTGERQRDPGKRRFSGILQRAHGARVGDLAQLEHTEYKPQHRGQYRLEGGSPTVPVGCLRQGARAAWPGCGYDRVPARACFCKPLSSLSP